MSVPICPFCSKPVEKAPQECPQCQVPYHPNCWRQVRFCMTCGLQNPDREGAQRGSRKVLIKAGEAVSIQYDEFLKTLAPYVGYPGRALPIVGIFLYLFRKASPVYLYLVGVGLVMVAIGWLIERTAGSYTLVSPSTRSIQRFLTLFGMRWRMQVAKFDQIASFRIEGEQRFKGDQKGVPSYFYNSFWVVVILKDGRHIRLSDDIRTDQDPDFVVGEEYEFGGLLPKAKKAGAVVGVDVYVAPNIRPYQVLPLMAKAGALVTVIVLIVLFL